MGQRSDNQHRGRIAVVGILCALMSVACGADGPMEGAGGAGGANAGAGGVGGASAGNGGAAASSSNASSSSSDASSTTTGGNTGEECQIMTSNKVCGSCLEGACCEVLNRCMDEDLLGCIACLDCFLEGNGPECCDQSVGKNNWLVECVAFNCVDECG